MVYDCWCGPRSPSWCSACQFPPLGSYSLYLLSTLCTSDRSHYVQPTYGVGVVPLSWGWSILQKLFGILNRVLSCFSFIYSAITYITYGLMDVCFILCAVIQYSLIFCIVQTITVLAIASSSICSYVPFYFFYQKNFDWSYLDIS